MEIHLRGLSACVLVAVIVSMGHAKEPACSAFHYEEKLLEKMIRMEIRVDKLYNEIKVKQDAINGALAGFEENQAALDGRQSTFSNTVDAMQVKLGAIEKIQGRFGDLESVDKTAPSTAPVIAFNANTLKSVTVIKGNKLIFTTELLNQGKAYSSSTGQFSAPVNGLFWFSLFVCTNKPSSANFAIMHEVHVLIKGTAYENDGYSCTSASVVASLTAGQRVWIEALGSDTYYVNSAYAMNTFTGALLHRQ